ncbi:hypothetical protein M9H77_09251 [Catharanthus roseus]|uniref:Uncharacterized protein n=1 Tax=Catharanthus roseus TaxID=4058 RepID=A0ACC0C046_CATRO|nr:hypothetical protein M9H77_09251 [Catharanthus roseus]
MDFTSSTSSASSSAAQDGVSQNVILTGQVVDPCCKRCSVICLVVFHRCSPSLYQSLDLLSGLQALSDGLSSGEFIKSLIFSTAKADAFGAPGFHSRISHMSLTLEEHYALAVGEEHETTCWGCGIRLLVSPYAPVFKCGWCGAITNKNSPKYDNKCYKWRRLRDRCFVGVLVQVVVSGQSTLYYFPSVSFLIGNCVGAANHRSFILFLMSTVTSTVYVSLISAYTALYIWPPINYRVTRSPEGLNTYKLVFTLLKEAILSFLRSAVFITPRGLVLVYLFIASVSVQIGLSVLLWQQLCYIYKGKTYLSQLSSSENEESPERDCQNFVRFFGCQYATTRYFPSFWNSRKSHKK